MKLGQQRDLDASGTMEYRDMVKIPFGQWYFIVTPYKDIKIRPKNGLMLVMTIESGELIF